ncbi:hypothetical protein M0P48_05800 [Candidatus Gracilibacteria bacterium]|jgi:hypothetical protein|nr:hypothetical protein [Candidatus Gracilibacteria bacterium]
MNLKQYLFGRYLDEGEKLLYVAHRHPLVLKLSTAKPFFFGIFIPVGLYFLFPNFLPFLVVWLVLGMIFWFYNFLDWYLDVWILTNIGVVEVLQHGLLNFTSKRVEYHMIEGISYSIRGVLQTIFSYGDIQIDKMGSQIHIILEDAASPKKLERLIMKYQDKYVYDRSIRDHQMLKGMLSEMIACDVQSERIKLPKKK